MFEKVTIFLTKLVKPFVYLLTSLWGIFQEMDKWFSGKKPVTKNSIRWGFIALIIFCFYVKERLDNADELDNADIISTAELNACKKEVVYWQQKYIQRIENENTELKEIKRQQDSSKRKIKEITKEI